MSIGLALRGHWCSFLGVINIVFLQKPEEVGGTKAVKGKDRSSHQHSCNIEAGKDCFLFYK